MRTRGVAPDVVPERFISTELLPLLTQDQTGIRTAVIRAETGNDELLHELRRRGGDVDLAIAYRTVAADLDLEQFRILIATDAIDAVTFTSASTVDHFLGKLTGEERTRILQHAQIASIGEATSTAIRRYGKVVARNATIQDLHDAMVEMLSIRT